MKYVAALIFLLCSMASGLAETALNDPRLEARAQTLFAELRCLVCEGQSLAQSEAPLAQDMRELIRERLRDGEREDDIRAYLKERYGDYIFLRPPLNRHTFLLWATPFLLLVLGGIAAAVVIFRLRGRI